MITMIIRITRMDEDVQEEEEENIENWDCENDEGTGCDVIICIIQVLKLFLV